MSRFGIGDRDFLLDGEPFRILSGALHYFRVHPGEWRDRIEKARLMGLNTIETYVAWNAHEPHQGRWDESGWNDLGAFLDAIADAGLYAIVRPGPYICAEWHNGGLPAWLTAIPGLTLRSSDPRYLEHVKRYLERVYSIVSPRQIDAGGNVILVQIENEYGAYGADADYLRELVEMTRVSRITVPLTTIDQPIGDMLRDGSIDGVHRTASFGSRARERLATLREHQPTGPLMCAEFWDGWFDWWGGIHHTTSAEDAAAELDSVLASGASVNIYMFHGGTNFGLTNGANHKGRYLPITTSYDYDAPLDEAGNPTAKYFAFRDVIARHRGVLPEEPPGVVTPPSLEVPLTSRGPWLAESPGTTVAPVGRPLLFDEISSTTTLAIYDTVLPDEVFEGADRGLLAVDEVRDFAWIEVDSVRVGTLSRILSETSLTIPRGRRLRIIVEDLGRVDYGEHLGEPKGLIGTPRLNGVPLEAWGSHPIDVAHIGAAFAEGRLNESSAPTVGPTAFTATFDRPADSHLLLDTQGWGRGYALVNDLLLGRYWSNGPQRTLYVPRAALRERDNRLVVLEHGGLDELGLRARFVATPQLGPVEE